VRIPPQGGAAETLRVAQGDTAFMSLNLGNPAMDKVIVFQHDEDGL